MRPAASSSSNPNPEGRGQRRNGRVFLQWVKERVAAGVASTVHVKSSGLNDRNGNNCDEKAEDHVVTGQTNEKKWSNMRGRTVDSKGRHFGKLQRRAMATFAAEKVGEFLIRLGFDMCL